MATAFGLTASSAVVAHRPRPAVYAWQALGPPQIALLCFLPSVSGCSHVQSKQEPDFFPSLHFLSRFHLKPLSALSRLLLLRQLILCDFLSLQAPSIPHFQYFTSAFPRLAQLLLFLEQSYASSLSSTLEATYIQHIAFPSAQYLDSVPIHVSCSQTLAFYSDHVRFGRR